MLGLYSVYCRRMRCVFSGPPGKGWLLFDNPLEVRVPQDGDNLREFLEGLETLARKEGLWIVGYAAYEAAPGFDRALTVHDPRELSYPSACFGLYREPRLLESFPLSGKEEPCILSPFIPEITRRDYLGRVAQLRDQLERGNAYQVNLTYRMRARFAGNPGGWFASRTETRDAEGRRCGDHLAYVENGPVIFASLSPELFFESLPGADFTTLRFKPMKGTAKTLPGREDAIAEALRRDPKNRAENLMIVDMIRNDSGKIALSGSIRVPSLFETEIHPTVIQMTSTVEAHTNAPWSAVFSAAFPCASITGAPKVRSMELIRDSEISSRGIYTGSIGFVRPDLSACFNVAIRTAVFDQRDGSVEYGVGGGILWESDPESEYLETLMKAAVLGDEGDFYVFESLLLEDGEIALLDRHLQRLEKSLMFFGFHRSGFGGDGYDPPVFIEAMKEKLLRIAREFPLGDYKIRFEVRRGDDPSHLPSVDCTPVPLLAKDYTIALSKDRLDSRDPFTGHKTSYRHFIDRAVAATAPGGLGAEGHPADLVLVNLRGELTETTRGNVVLSLGGKMLTPKLSAGALPGTLRAELIFRGELEEAILTEGDYRDAEEVYMINSLRGMVRCRRIGD